LEGFSDFKHNCYSSIMFVWKNQESKKTFKKIANSFWKSLLFINKKPLKYLCSSALFVIYIIAGKNILLVMQNIKRNKEETTLINSINSAFLNR